MLITNTQQKYLCHERKCEGVNEIMIVQVLKQQSVINIKYCWIERKLVLLYNGHNYIVTIK